MKSSNGVKRRMIRRRYFGDVYRVRMYRGVYKPYWLVRDDGKLVPSKFGSKTNVPFVCGYRKQLDEWKYGEHYVLFEG